MPSSNTKSPTAKESAKSYFKLFSLNNPRDYFVTVDHFPLWRRHLVWARTMGGDKKEGKELRDHMTQRFSTNMVFMGLLMSTELNILFSPCDTSTEMRLVLQSKNGHRELIFYAGVFLIISVFLTFFALLATFTAWAIISSISDSNAHCILRSRIGLTAAQLPSRLIASSIYMFFVWNTLLVWVLIPPDETVWLWILISIFACSIFLYIVSIYSSLGNLIMKTSAMSNKRILEAEEEKKKNPFMLEHFLIEKAKEYESDGMDVTKQYIQKDQESKKSLLAQDQQP